MDNMKDNKLYHNLRRNYLLELQKKIFLSIKYKIMK
jgi:hypothetical protein